MPILAAPSESSTTVAQWIEEVREHIDGDRPEEANRLATSYTAGDGTITLLDDLEGIGRGTILSIAETTMRVVTVNPANRTVGVIAPYQGSTDANQPAGTVVRVNPRFTDHRILRALNRNLSALSAPSLGLFQAFSDTLTYSETLRGYELSDPRLLRVLEVRAESPGSDLAWPRVRSSEWDVVRAAPTADFPSGVALRLRGGNSGRAVQVVYAAPFDTVTALTDSVSDTGISAEAEDIPPLGAAIRLVAGREVPRNQTGSQGDTRRANEVPPGAVAASVRGLMQEWVRRVREENARLRSQWPVGK